MAQNLQIRSALQAYSTLSEDLKKELASIILQQVTLGQDIQVLSLDLSTARSANDPFVLPSFKTLFVQSATDASCSVNLRLNSRAAHSGTVAVKNRDVISQAMPFSSGYLDWSAQSGKTMTVVLFAGAEFQSGSSIQTTQGGAVISEGSIVASATAGVVGLAAAVLLAQDFTRTTSIIQNRGSVSIFVGGSTVTVGTGARPGLEIQPGGFFEWKNSAALYAISTVAAQSVAIVNQTAS